MNASEHRDDPLDREPLAGELRRLVPELPEGRAAVVFARRKAHRRRVRAATWLAGAAAGLALVAGGVAVVRTGSRNAVVLDTTGTGTGTSVAPTTASSTTIEPASPDTTLLASLPCPAGLNHVAVGRHTTFDGQPVIVAPSTPTDDPRQAVLDQWRG
ncbi:MAG: hypothetical protein IT196_26775, partial [Acidimicrobiales bacterium]|nr:hypothetical protein [Acidimicrobiales bacterium]